MPPHCQMSPDVLAEEVREAARLGLGGVLLFGVLAFRVLPVNDLPTVDFPTISVSASGSCPPTPGASAPPSARA